jgi:hypothetical protein
VVGVRTRGAGYGSLSAADGEGDAAGLLHFLPGEGSLGEDALIAHVCVAEIADGECERAAELLRAELVTNAGAD